MAEQPGATHEAKREDRGTRRPIRSEESDIRK